MKGRVLIADDEAAVRGMIAKTLQMSGYVCDTVDGYRSARERLEAEEYDVLVTDKNMPMEGRANEGGMELIRWVRQNRPNVTVLVMTGFPTVDSAVEVLKLGAFDYLLKPFDFRVLLQKMDRILEYRRFINAEAVLDLYLTINRDIIEMGGGQSQQLESRLNQAREKLDHIFKSLRSAEGSLLEHRQRLAEIAAYAERTRDRLTPGDPAREFLQHIVDEASIRA